MWDKAKRVYLINGMVITKELATSFVSVGTIKELRPFPSGIRDRVVR